ncbi:hypothetical protein ACOSQ2_003660 [Xanthoceras sorbifolium]
MPLETILKHDLNPLKVCLPSVASEFLRQSKAVRLFTVSRTFIFNDLLESELSRAFGGIERLNMFFPFDPCLLKKCDRFTFTSFGLFTFNMKISIPKNSNSTLNENVSFYLF